MEVFSFTAIGKRKVNEDLLLELVANDGTKLFSVIDGMGGYEKGELAAQIVSESIQAYFTRVDTINEYHIQKAVMKACLAIKQAKEDSSVRMGATFGGVYFSNSTVSHFWVGDVGLMHFRDEKIVFESSPHSVINDFLKQGKPVGHIRREYYEHLVTRAITGHRKSCELDLHVVPITSKSEILIICSDGVYRAFSAIQIENLLQKAISFQDFYEKLCSELRKNAEDNSTFWAIRL